MFGLGVGSALEGSVEDGHKWFGDKMSFLILSLAVRTRFRLKPGVCRKTQCTSVHKTETETHFMHIFLISGNKHVAALHEYIHVHLLFCMFAVCFGSTDVYRASTACVT